MHNIIQPQQPNMVLQDPNAKKPEDWVDEAQIEDPEEVKPDGWDQPEFIVDPEAVQPEDWDVEEDGQWEAPQVRNPEFKGEWKPKMIDNPDYKGEWEVRGRHVLLHYCSHVCQYSHALLVSFTPYPLLKIPRSESPCRNKRCLAHCCSYCSI